MLLSAEQIGKIWAESKTPSLKGVGLYGLNQVQSDSEGIPF